MQTIKRAGILLSFLLFFAAMLAFLYFVWEAGANYAEDSPMEVFFLKTINDADCALIKHGDACIVIDTGEEADAPAILAFLQEQQVQSIDYLVLTHPDAGHVGGALAILEQFGVRHVIQPYINKDHETTRALTGAIKASGVPILYATRPQSFICGGLTMTVFAPLEKNYKKSNNYSLAVLVNHKEVNMVFAGDAEGKRLGEMMRIHWPGVQLYQAAHHGRGNQSSGAFIELLRPQYTVVTATSSDQAVRDACGQVNSMVYYTGDGTVCFYSDGKTLVPITQPGENRQVALDT